MIKDKVQKKRFSELYKCIVVIFSFLGYLESYSQNVVFDNEYWFAIPSVAHGYRSGSHFRIATYDDEATVTLSIPANNTFTPKIITIPSHSVGVIGFTDAELGIGPPSGGFPTILGGDPNVSPLVNNVGDSITDTGILITTTARVQIYYESGSTTSNTDFTSLKGIEAMGTSFLVPMQQVYNVRNVPAQPVHHSVGKHGFLITATQNNTEVTIVPKVNLTGRAAGVPFTIMLNQGQTYFAQNPTTTVPAGSSGSTVQANKPVVVTIYADQMQIPSTSNFNLGMEQIVPTISLGTKYIVMRGDLSVDETIHITAVNDDTIVTVTGGIVVTLDASETYTYTTSSVSVTGIYISATDDVAVLHVSGKGTEATYALVPPIDECGRGVSSSSVIRSQQTTSGSNPQSFTVVILTQDPTGFQVNGNPNVIQNFLTIRGLPGWYCCKIDITSSIPNTSNSIVEIVNTNGSNFHLGVIHGQSSLSGVRYSYFTEYSPLNLAFSLESISLCQGKDAELKIIGALSGDYNYSWVGPNGFTSSLPNPIITNVGAQNSGDYTLTVEGDDCSAEAVLTLIIKPCMMISNPMIRQMVKRNP
jgi:hypothetical protein